MLDQISERRPDQIAAFLVAAALVLDERPELSKIAASFDERRRQLSQHPVVEDLAPNVSIFSVIAIELPAGRASNEAIL